MLRIETARHGTGETTLRAAGRLAGPWVAELERSVAEGVQEDALVIDLTDVSFADRAGIEFLKSLRRDGRIRLRCSAVVAEQLT